MGRRAPGEGSVYHDAARGLWVGSVDIGRDPRTGKRRRRKVSAATATECRSKLDALRRSKHDGAVPRGDVTVRDLVGDWLAHPGPRVRSWDTRDVHQDAADRIVKALGGIKAAKLTPRQAEQLLEAMAERGYATQTIGITKWVLVGALRRGMRDGVLGRNVAELIDCPSGTRRQSRALNGEQVAALLALDLSPWWRAYILTGACTGMRPGELLGIAWADIDLDAGVFRVRCSLKPLRDEDGRTVYEGGRAALVRADLKTATSRRTLQLEDYQDVAVALAALRRQQAADKLRAGGEYHDQGLVFCGPLGHGIWHQQIAAKFKALCKRAGLGGDWQPRELRHTFVSVQSDAGIAIEQIADAVGHVNSRVTQTVYRHALRDAVRIVPRKPTR